MGVYFALRGVEVAAVWAQLRRANYLWFLLSIVLVTLSFPLRAMRWRILMARSGSDAPLMPVWEATAIGFMANNVLPARTGEVARAYAASGLVGLPVSTALASIGVERIFDGLVLIFLLTIGVASPDFPPGARIGDTSVTGLAVWTGSAFGVILLLFIFLAHAPAGVYVVFDRWVHRLLPKAAANYTARLFRNLVDGLSILRKPRDVGRVLVWSFAVWLVNAAGYYTGFRSFLGLFQLPFSSALLLQGIVALGVAIPSSPGFFGPFEAFCRYTLALYSVPAPQAIGFAVGIHLGWWLPITVLGVAILARTGLSLRELGAKQGAG